MPEANESTDPKAGTSATAAPADDKSSTEPAAKDSKTSPSSTDAKSALQRWQERKGFKPKGETAKPEDKKADQPADGKKPDAEPEPKKDEPDPELERAKGLSRIARLNEELETKSKAFDGKVKAFEEERKQFAPLKAAREELAAANKLEDAKEKEQARARALVKLIGNDVTVTDIANLSAMLGNGPPPITREDLEREFQERLDRYKQSLKDEEEKRRNDQAAANEATYKKEYTEAGKLFAADKKKYPAIAYRDLSMAAFRKFHETYGRSNNKWPTAQEILDHIEAAYRKEAADGLLPHIDPGRKPAPSLGADDRRGAETEEENPDGEEAKKPAKTAEERRAEQRERFARFKREAAAKLKAANKGS